MRQLELGNLESLILDYKLLLEVSNRPLLFRHDTKGVPKSCFSMAGCFSIYNGFRLRAWLISTWGA